MKTRELVSDLDEYEIAEALDILSLLDVHRVSLVGPDATERVFEMDADHWYEIL